MAVQTRRETPPLRGKETYTMADQKIGASYLDRQPFIVNRDKLLAWGTWGMALGIVAAIGLVYLVLVVAYVLMAVNFNPAAPAPTPAQDPAKAIEQLLEAMEDPKGDKKISFIQDSQKHYYFNDNKKGKQLLVITGRVRNGYSEARRYIRLSAGLLDENGRDIHRRDFYAGNIMTDEQLTDLDPYAIYSLLDIRSGTDGINMNVAPGAEIPFMIVFDRLPENMAEYHLDVIGSDLVLDR